MTAVSANPSGVLLLLRQAVGALRCELQRESSRVGVRLDRELALRRAVRLTDQTCSWCLRRGCREHTIEIATSREVCQFSIAINKMTDM